MKIKASLTFIKQHAMKSRYFHEKSNTGQDKYFIGNEEESFKDLTTLTLMAKGQVCFVDSRCQRLGELSVAVSTVQRTDKRGNENFQLVSLSVQR